MDEVEYSHLRKRPRLLATGTIPSINITSSNGIGVPQGPLFSVMEPGGDGPTAGEFEGKTSEAVLMCQSKSGTSSEGELVGAAALSTSTGSSSDAKAVSSTTKFFVASIPGLFLLEANNLHQLQQQSLTNMDFQEQSATAMAPRVEADDVDIVMGDHATDPATSLSNDVEMPREDENPTNDMAINEDKIQSSNDEFPAVQNLPKEHTQANVESIFESVHHEQPVQTISLEKEEADPLATHENPPTSEKSETEDENMLERPQSINVAETEAETDEPRGKAAYDPDFLAAAEANKGDEAAEWQFDSSDAESTGGEDGSASSDSDSEESSEEESDSDAEDAEFPSLSLAEQAKILMADADEDGERGGAKGEVLRTKNEQPEDAIVVTKPDIVLTESDIVEELGEVQSVVDKVILIKAKTSGEYRVLNEGSVVALQDRRVIGTIADLLGRVQSPLYIVRFATTEEITENGIMVGTKLFYSPAHSTFVFTKSLKAQKGSDASNLYDEEVDEHEKEFSDDEAEAEYKRKLKEDRATERGRKGPVERGGKGANGRKAQYATTSGLSTSTPDEPYTPLARPPAMSDFMKSVAHMQQAEEIPRANKGNQGEKHGRDDFRGRGGRGGNKGGRDDRRGGGGGGGGGRDNGRGYVDRNRGNRYERDSGTGSSSAQPHYSSSPQAPQSFQQQATAPSYQPNQQTYQQTPPAPQFGYPYNYMQQSYQQPLQQSPQPPSPYQFQSPPSVQSNYSYGAGAPPQSHMFTQGALSPPIPKLPHGAHVNPAFFARQVQASQQQQQQQPAYYNPPMMWGQQQPQQSSPLGQGQFNWSPPVMPPQQADAVMKAVQDQLDILKGVRK